MANLTVAEVLDRAADLIEPAGAWTQGKWGSPETCMCAEGAIFAACEASPMYDRNRIPGAIGVLTSMLPAIPRGNPIAFWNDDPERTQAEVVAKLREAAALARERAS